MTNPKPDLATRIISGLLSAWWAIVKWRNRFINNGPKNFNYAMGKLRKAIGKRRLVPGLQLPKDGVQMAQWHDSDKTIRHISYGLALGENPFKLTLVHRFDALVSA